MHILQLVMIFICTRKHQYKYILLYQRCFPRHKCFRCDSSNLKTLSYALIQEFLLLLFFFNKAEIFIIGQLSNQL